jgi:hypothetical protein
MNYKTRTKTPKVGEPGVKRRVRAAPLPEVTTEVVEALGELVREELRNIQMPNPWLAPDWEKPSGTV